MQVATPGTFTNGNPFEPFFFFKDKKTFFLEKQEKRFFFLPLKTKNGSYGAVVLAGQGVGFKLAPRNVYTLSHIGQRS